MVIVAGSLSSTVLQCRSKLLFPLSSFRTKLTTFPTTRYLRFNNNTQSQVFCNEFCAPFSSNLSTTQFNSHKTHVSSMDNWENLVVLGIETSCDDTAAAVVRGNGEILSQVVASQADLLAQYGGVAPKMAEEAHSRAINQVTQSALDKAQLTAKDLSAVAVTIGPGLSLCLRVGVRKAREIAGGFQLPIVGVHHMEAHTLVARLTDRNLQFPFMALLISGGHNLLILARGLGHYIQLGTTIDDAIGEAYDKTAKWLGLDMRKSGGPSDTRNVVRWHESRIGVVVPNRETNTTQIAGVRDSVCNLGVPFFFFSKAEFLSQQGQKLKGSGV